MSFYSQECLWEKGRALFVLMPLLKKWRQKLLQNSFSHKVSFIFPSWRKIHEKYALSMLVREEEKQLEKHPPPSSWRHISWLSCSRQWHVGFYKQHICGPTQRESFGGCHTLEWPQVFLFWCRGPVAVSHILPPSEKAYQEKSFPLTARSRWAFSKTHNSSSQRNNLDLSEDSFKVVQRTSGLGLVSMQAQETTRFSWLRYFHDGIKHLCLFSIFFFRRERTYGLENLHSSEQLH